MIIRRSKLFLLALLSGLVWFVLGPLCPKSLSIYESSDHTEYKKLPSEEESDSLHFQKSSIRRSTHTEVNDYDLSEVDFPPEEEKDKIQKVPMNFKRSGVAIGQQHFPTLSPTKAIVQSAGVNPSLKKKKVATPGHRGRMVHIDPLSLSHEDRKIYDAGWRNYFHNEYVNKMISTQRVLLDVQDPGCRSLEYASDLPDVSVVIVFYNEAWSSLLRTVHSVLDRSPPDLIKEVILVDDASNLYHLKVQLSNYMSHLPKVHIYRIKTRLGASAARNVGAARATGKVVVFLDAHCECTTGWLEPLLAHVAKNETNVAIPVLDVIDDDTFAYKAYGGEHIRIGGFDWTLTYKWTEIPYYEKQRRTNDVDPIRNPVMWGGIFAISRSFFTLLDGFDETLHLSGMGQNMEMSFKIWLCGGSLETIPCSHVGHLFHQQVGHTPPFSNTFLQRNSGSIAQMWLDEFKDMHFQRTRNLAPVPTNNSAEHLNFRLRLHCRPFSWYIQNVYPELFTPELSVAFGKIRSKVKPLTADKSYYCVSLIKSGAENKPAVSACQSNETKKDLWSLSRLGEIRQGEQCLDFPGNSIIMYPCHGGRGNQEWTYKEDRTIQQVGTKRCMALSSDRLSLLMEECTGSDNQIWYWKRNADIKPLNSVDQGTVVKQELAAVTF